MKFKTITPVASEPVTTADVYLQVKDSSTAEDTLVASWLTAARVAAEHYTGSAFGSRTLEAAADIFPGCEDGYQFTLPLGPVTSITSIKYTDTAGAEQTVSSSDYALSTYGTARTVSLALDASWPSDVGAVANAVRVRYVTGFSSLPAAVKSAILLIVAWLKAHRGDEVQLTGDDLVRASGAAGLLDTERVFG